MAQHARVLLAPEVIITDKDNWRPIPIKQIAAFCAQLSSSIQQTPDYEHQATIVCSGNKNPAALTNASLLLGSYLIMHRGETCTAVTAAFEELSSMVVPYADDSTGGYWNLVTVQSCWQALDHAVRLGWIVQPSSDDEPILDIDELTHYASVANGAVHLVIPGALIFFPTPADDLVLQGRDWVDSETNGCRTSRRFSPGFYASLLAGLGVSAVACLGSGSPAASLAFNARGIAAMDLASSQSAALASDPDGDAQLPAIVHALDRLLALADATPGAIAMHSGSETGWPESVGTLAAAFLIRRFEFSDAGAVAWLHMLAPWMLR